jgi:hypothetical protein
MNKSYVEEIRLCFYIACSLANQHSPNQSYEAAKQGEETKINKGLEILVIGGDFMPCRRIGTVLKWNLNEFGWKSCWLLQDFTIHIQTKMKETKAN